MLGSLGWSIQRCGVSVVLRGQHVVSDGRAEDAVPVLEACVWNDGVAKACVEFGQCDFT